MKDSPLNQHWQRLVQRAREDAPPAVDAAELHRAVTAEWQAQQAAAHDWCTQLLEVCSVPRAWRWCIGGASTSAAVIVWQLWLVRQDLAWAQYAGLGMGGGW